MVKESEVSGKVQQNDIHLFYGRLLLAYEPRQNAMKTSKNTFAPVAQMLSDFKLQVQLLRFVCIFAK